MEKKNGVWSLSPAGTFIFFAITGLLVTAFLLYFFLTSYDTLPDAERGLNLLPYAGRILLAAPILSGIVGCLIRQLVLRPNSN
jgi:hypothetical protein